MYNGIGLETPRGTGTSGYVQKNYASVRKAVRRPEGGRREGTGPRKANAEILEHEKRRRIEVQVAEFEEEMVGKGFSPTRIEFRLKDLRKRLEEDLDRESNRKETFRESDRHMRAHRKEGESKRLRRALRVDEDYKEGDFLRRDRKRGKPDDDGLEGGSRAQSDRKQDSGKIEKENKVPTEIGNNQRSWRRNRRHLPPKSNPGLRVFRRIFLNVKAATGDLQARVTALKKNGIDHRKGDMVELIDGLKMIEAIAKGLTMVEDEETVIVATIEAEAMIVAALWEIIEARQNGEGARNLAMDQSDEQLNKSRNDAGKESVEQVGSPEAKRSRLSKTDGDVEGAVKDETDAKTPGKLEPEAEHEITQSQKLRTERGEVRFRIALPVARVDLDEDPLCGAGAVQVDHLGEGSTVSRGAEGACHLGGVALTEEGDTQIDAAEVVQDPYQDLSLAQGPVPAPVPDPTQDRHTARRVRGALGEAVTPEAQGAIVATLLGREGALARQ
ncbi:hypothetical protein NDN08_005155 [Rhodosorus marinus]|uniref:CWF21 domain-containing protein n=1 Tax=Rhodosorus marinus TaxID=101924 RepID=A0AAV8V3C5_9RHOD|nr:hypothetical protein NDN08_005155 [Rhodosorus marinus]